MTATAETPDVPVTSVLTPAAVVPAPRTSTDTEVVRRPGEVVVTVLGVPGPRTVPTLSCRLHEAIDAAVAGDVLTVDLGSASAADPAVERILLCARESATARGITFRLR